MPHTVAAARAKRSRGCLFFYFPKKRYICR